MDTSLRTREERKKLYKFRTREGITDLPWTKWNIHFKSDLESYERDDLWMHYAENNDEEEDMSYQEGCDCDECNAARNMTYPIPYPVKKKTYPQQEAPMYANATANYATAIVATPRKSETETQREYLLDRLSAARSDIRENESIAFGLTDDKPPKTIKERKQRFADGKYTISWEYDDADFKDEHRLPSYASSGRIVWRDPAKVKDEAGFETAMEKMEADSDATTDIIRIKSADEGLTAVQDFAKKTYH